MKRIIVLIMIATMIFGTVSFAVEDVPSTWAESGIDELKSSNEFRAETFNNYQENITRGEFIYLAVRIYEILDGKEIIVDPKIVFTDTNDTYAVKGATVGITTGIGNDEFGASELLTREQLAVLMMNVLKIGNVELESNDGYKFIDDVAFSDWAKDSIYTAKANGIIGGVGNDMFDSRGNATVEQAIVISNKILKNNNDKEFGSDAKANGELAHIINLVAESNDNGVSIADTKAVDVDFKSEKDLLDSLSKYGKIEGTNKNVVVFGTLIEYYPEGSENMNNPHLTIAFESDNYIQLDFNAYNDTIKSLVADVLEEIFPDDANISDVYTKMFQDIEGTKITSNLGRTVFQTSKLDQQERQINDISVKYREFGHLMVDIKY